MENILLKEIPADIIAALTRKDLIALLEGEQKIRLHFQQRCEELQEAQRQLSEELIEINGKYVRIKKFIFDRKSEKLPSPEKEKKKGVGGRAVGSRNKNLLDRYPNLPIVEERIYFETAPTCACCQSEMTPSGLSEQTQYLNVHPKVYEIVVQSREKYRCGTCHGSIQTAPCPPRIKPGSAYSDDFIIDV